MTTSFPPLRPFVISSGRCPTHVTDDGNLIGGKAVGLLRLPSEWTPPFLVLTRMFDKLIHEAASARLAFERLPLADRELVIDFLNSVTDDVGGPTLLVRSNAPSEDIGARGKYHSVACQSTLDSVLSAAEEIVGTSEDGMCVIIQRAVQPGLLGHMSNERRVSPRASNWLVEGLGADGSEAFGRMITAARTANPAALNARIEREVVARLREVAGYLVHLAPGVFHCEWVWDGTRLWVVQCDVALTARGAGDADSALRAVGDLVPSYDQALCLRHFSNEPDRWQKLARPRMFRSLGLPVADIFVLTGDDWERSQKDNDGKVAADLTAMCRLGDVVLRCDVSSETPVSDVLLPTSPATRDPALLLAFAKRVAERFRTKGVAADHWALLPAFLYPARASAMAHARPRAERVRIDALWGYPDGLSYFPHDSWFYYPADGRAIEQRRHKGVCLMPDGSVWRQCSIGPPLDWNSTLNEAEVAVLASWALRVADALSSEIQLMALARIGGARGPEACLPWHYTTWEVPRYASSLRMLPPAHLVEIVRSSADLDRLRNGRMRPNVRGVYLQPESALLRDDNFLSDLAKVAATTEKVVYFEGSVLGHAYYMMARAGATIVPLNEAEPGESEKDYKKLVRDEIPLIIKRAGGLARVRRVPRVEARRLLRQKLVEEALEARSCRDEDLVDELADVLEVVNALCSFSEIDRAQLSRVRLDKRAKRGGFDKAVYLEATTIQPLRLSPAQNQGWLPLTDIDDSSPIKQRKSRNPAIVQELPARPGERGRLSVSLIPPPIGDPPVKLSWLALETRATVKYSEKTVEITVGHVGDAMSSNQLSLFPSEPHEGG